MNIWTAVRQRFRRDLPESRDEKENAVSTAVAATQPICQQQIVQTAQQNHVLDVATKRCLEVASQHPNAPAPVVRGWQAEVHHEATYNVRAIQAGAGQRAAVIPGNQAADIAISNAGRVEELVQVKMVPKAPALKRAISDPRYDGMQKVGPKGVNIKGVSDHIAAGGVRSEPITAEQGNAMVRDPAAHFDQYRPSTVSGAVKAGAVGAGMGAVVGAVVTLASALWTKGRVDKKDAVNAANNAAVGAVTTGLANSVSFLAGSSVAGMAVTTALAVGHAVRRSDRGCAGGGSVHRRHRGQHGDSDLVRCCCPGAGGYRGESGCSLLFKRLGPGGC